MTTQSTARDALPWPGLLMLSAVIFAQVTSEFLPTGLLPDMSHDLGVSEAQVGLLVTIFAGVVAVTTTPLTALTRNSSRKPLLVILMLVNAAAGVFAALAPDYGLLIAARVLAGLSYGLFWAVAGAYAAHLVPPQLLGRAVAITQGGGTAAFVLGIPTGTALGHALGWRLAFAVIGGTVALLALLVVRFLPSVDHRVRLNTGEITVHPLRDRSVPGVLVVCLMLVIVMVGQNLFYTYIAPWFLAVPRVDASAIAPLLFLYGGAGAVGLFLSGLVPDRLQRRAFLVALLVVAVSLTAIGLASHQQTVVVVAFAVWGLGQGSMPAMLQTRVLHAASPRMRDLAAAMLTTSFNVAIGGGALIGGLLLDGLGVAALPYWQLGLLLLGIVVTIAVDVVQTRRRTALA